VFNSNKNLIFFIINVLSEQLQGQQKENSKIVAAAITEVDISN
jgi:hypothetical protein